MAISNYIAQFGQNVGRDIQNTVGNALASREDQRRYDNALVDQKQDEERQFASQWAQSLAQAKTPEEKAMRWQGGYSEGMKRGYDFSTVPPTYDPRAEQMLMGATGVSPQAARPNDMPATVQEWQYFNSLTPEKKKEFLTMKRADKFLNLGGEQVRTGPMGGIEERFPVTPKPTETPEYKSDVAAKVEAARLGAKRTSTEEDKAASAQRTFEELIPSYQNLIADPSKLEKIYGRGESLYPDFLRSQEGIDLQSDRDQFVALLQLAAANKLKGQGTVTDSERNILLQSATVLANPNISAKKAETAITESMTLLLKKAGFQLMRDGNGNRAWVGQNGEIIEF